MRPTAKNTAGVAGVRSLCQLGLPAEQFIPALLEALHRVIPSLRNLFDWTDCDGNLVRYYFEGPIDHRIARHYFEEFHNRREAEVMPSFQQAVTGRAMVLPAAALDNAKFFGSALYNEIWRPQGLHSRIEAIVRDGAGGPLGSLVLYRGKDERPFTRDDEALLATLVPYIARALSVEAAAPAGFSDRPDGRASVVLSVNGELVQASQHAHRLLLLAHGGITPEIAGRAPRRIDFPTLSLLWLQVNAGVGARLRPASLAVENAWGRFVFDAEPMLPIEAGGESTPSVHVSIRHQIAAAVGLWHALDALPLSPMQRQVAALVYAGQSHAEIAAALRVAPSTVADHVKKIYAGLDAHSVRELRNYIDAARH